VVDEQAVLDVLAGVGEVEAEHLDVASGTGVLGVVSWRTRCPEGHVTCLKRRHGRPWRGVPDVDGVVVPVVDLTTVSRPRPDDDLDVVGQGRRADEAQHDRRPAVVPAVMTAWVRLRGPRRCR